MLVGPVPRRLWACGPFGGLQEELDRVLADVWGGGGGGSAMGYRVDVREDADHVYVEAELPGLSKDDLEITLEDGTMTITGEKKFARQEKEENYHVRERRFGKFCRAFQLPSVVDENKIRATLRDGVLLVTLDKREEVKPKRVEVQVG